jgi:hypothetical protein
MGGTQFTCFTSTKVPILTPDVGGRRERRVRVAIRGAGVSRIVRLNLRGLDLKVEAIC